MEYTREMSAYSTRNYILSSHSQDQIRVFKRSVRPTSKKRSILGTGNCRFKIM